MNGLVYFAGFSAFTVKRTEDFVHVVSKALTKISVNNVRSLGKSLLQR
jgi:hypothetical protein